MTKDTILSELKRTAIINGGIAMGWRQFATETGVREADWKGKFWARWSDAVREAGLAPNEMVQAHEQDFLLATYAQLARELGRLPVGADMRLASRQGTKLPAWNTYTRRFGGKAKLVARLRAYCELRPDHADVLALCDAYAPRTQDRDSNEVSPTNAPLGFVYLRGS